MSLSTWLSGTFSHSQARRAKRRNPVTTSSRRRRTCRPSLEGLEIRLTLSLTTLASFGCPDGYNPHAGLIMDSSGNLYGTMYSGGASNDGTVFELAHGSGTLTALASFSGANGQSPYAGLIMDSSGNLYGTTSAGGASSDGTVFELAQGSGTITTLASFNGTNGQSPYAGLIMDSSGNLYGTSEEGGASKDGTVFEMAHGSGKITTLASFKGTNGKEPYASLIMDSSGNLFGTTYSGGASNLGTVFELAQGSGTITTLVSFNGTDGLEPKDALIMDSSGNLYGTTYGGGASNDGTVFELSGPDARPASQISGLPPSTGAGASHAFTVTVPNAVGTTDNLYADIGTDPFSEAVPQKTGKPASTDAL